MQCQNVIKTGKETKKILSDNCQVNTNISSMKNGGGGGARIKSFFLLPETGKQSYLKVFIYYSNTTIKELGILKRNDIYEG